MFDPYRKWLGIPPKDQPPNHYRLLSLELFEDDADVIEGAADRAMGFIRQYQSGENAALAAKLLNEIATARLCLLKTKTKAEYDVTLKQELASSDRTPSPSDDRPYEIEAALMEPANLPEPAGTYKTRRTRIAQKKSDVPSRTLIAGGIGVAVLVVVVVVVLFNGGNKPESNPNHQDTQIAKSNPSIPAIPEVEPTKPQRTLAVKSKSEREESDPDIQPAGPPVDLISLVDFARDKVAWEWKKEGTSLICGPGGALYFPSALPDNYQLRFTLKRLDGIDGLSIGFTMNGRQGLVAIDGYNSTLSGLFVDGRHCNSNCTTRRGALFRNGTSSTLVLTVRPGHVRADVDNQTVIDWYGNPERLFIPPDHGIINRESPYIVAGPASYQFESAVMTPIKPESALKPIARLNREIEMLPLIDVTRDAPRGKWEIRNSVLSSQEGWAGIYLPTTVPEEYTLTATVELPVDSPDDWSIVFGLVSGGSSFQFTSHRAVTGLEMIDGHRWNDNETRIDGPILKPGIRSQFDFTVTKSGIRTEVEGKTLIDWRGDVRRLSIQGDWALADGRRIFFASNHPIRFSDIKIGPPRPRPKLPSQPQFLIGQSTDLLALIDPKRDALSGTWQRDGTAIRAMADIVGSKLVIPFELPPEYRLKIKIAREVGGLTNDDAFLLTVPTANSKANITIDGFASTISAIPVDVRSYTNSQVTYRDRLILDGPAQEFECFVRAAGIQFLKEGKTIFDWKGSPNRLVMAPEHDSPGSRICLASWNSRFRIEKLELEPLQQSSFPPIATLGADGNLLSVIDPQRDSRRGEWKLTADSLVCPVSHSARIQIPCTIPERYELTALVERKSGVADFHIGLIVGGKPCTAGIDGGSSNIAGLMSLDNATFFIPSNPTCRNYPTPLLPLGKPVRIRCFVLPDTVIVCCENQEVLRWHGDVRRFTLDGYFAPNVSSDDYNQLSLGAWDSEFLIRELTLKPVSDDDAKRISDEFTGVYPMSAQLNVPLAIAPDYLSAGEPNPIAKTVDDAKKPAGPSGNPKPVTTLPLPKGKWIDLLEMVQLPEHAQIGSWKRRDDGTLICEPSQDARIMVPIALRGSYELKCEFTRSSGNQNIAVVFPVSVSSCSATLSALAGTVSGLTMIDGLGLDKIPAGSAAVVRPGMLANGKHYELQIQVTQSGERITIKTTLDGKRFAEWQGNAVQLACSGWQSLPCPQSIGIIASESQTEFHKLELRLANEGNAYALGNDWKSPLAEVAAAPPKDVAASCVDWNGKKYFISKKPMTLPLAQRLASQLHGRLLTVSSPEEEIFIYEKGRDRCLWTAGWRRQDSKEWRDERNRPLKYFGTWATGQPEFGPRDLSIAIHGHPSFRGWHDYQPWYENHACIEWGEEYPKDN